MTRDELLRLAITDVFRLMGDVDGVVADMLRPARARELGPIMHASLYGDAHAGILDNLRHMAAMLEPDDGDGGPPSEGTPPWEPSGGVGPIH